MGIIINHYKDHYETTSIMESKRVFFVAHLHSKRRWPRCPSTHVNAFCDPKNTPEIDGNRQFQSGRCMGDW